MAQLFDTDSQDEFETERAHLDTDWACANAFRELIRIARRGSIEATYKQAIALGEKLIPETFAPEKRLLRGAKESSNARYMRQVAEAETIRRGRVVHPIEVGEKMVADEREKAVLNPEADLIETRAQNLEAALQELKPKRSIENNLILGDVYRVERNLPITDIGKTCVQFKLDKKRALRIRVLHNAPPEAKSGADLIYEHLDLKREMARLCLIQYKMWDGKSLHQKKDVIAQLAKIKEVTCDQGLCLYSHVEGGSYRLPHCTAFLRPTDRLQQENSAMISSGFHIPICVVAKCWEGNQRDGKSLRRKSIEDRSLSHVTFEELFNSRMVGSVEITFEDLKAIYDDFKIFEYDHNVLIHAQEFTI